jgi:hypothetical protein
MFPAGRAGVGLLLLRLSTVAALLIGTQGEFGPTLHGYTAMACWTLAVPLGIGLATVICAAAYLVVDVELLLTAVGPHVRFIAVAALLSASLALLGPGAYSLDARLFGRRVVVFRNNRSRADRRT